MKRLVGILGIVGAIGIALGAFNSAASAANTARVRVVHASPDAPAVDVYADGAKVLTNVAYKGSSDYLTVPAGAHNFKVFATGANPTTGTPVINADATLDAGKDYTVAAIGKLAQIKALVLVDNNATPAAGEAHVRVVHASPDAPAVDIAVKGGPVLFPNLAFGKDAGPSPVDAGTYDLEVRPTGTTTVALAINGVQLQAGKIYTIFAVGLLNGTPKLEALPIVSDPAPAPVAAPAPTSQPAAPVAPSGSSLPKTGTGSTGSGGVSMWLVVGMAALGVIVAVSGTLVAVRQRSR
jgi:hypothetical protein